MISQPILTSFVASCVLALACSGRDETVLARNVAVAVGTTRLEAKDVLEAQRVFSGMELEIAGAVGHTAGPAGFRLPNGTFVKLQAEAVDRGGKHYALPDVSSGSSGGRYFFGRYSRDLPKHAEFVALLIKSDTAFRTPQVAWVSWDPK
jgi:hypothetical protein